METMFPISRLRQAFACHQHIYKKYSQSVMGADLQNLIVYQFFTATNAKGEKDGMGFQEAYEERLALMKDLTLGDFATVKRQCLLLGEDLSADAWLDQLEIEVKAKHRAGNDEHDRSLRTA